MPTHVRVSGSWKAVNKIHTRVSGSWKEVTRGWVRVSGVWKEFYTNFTPTTLANPDNVGTLSNGNLTWTSNAAPYRHVRSASSKSSGKLYVEATVAVTGYASGIGFHPTSYSLPNDQSSVFGSEARPNASSWLQYDGSSNLWWVKDETSGDSGLSKVSGSTKLMAAIDFAAGKIWYGRNGVWFNSGNPATGANPTDTFTANTAHYFHVSGAEDSTGNFPSLTVNFGGSAFSHLPSGFTGWPA